MRSFGRVRKGSTVHLSKFSSKSETIQHFIEPMINIITIIFQEWHTYGDDTTISLLQLLDRRYNDCLPPI